MMDSPLSNMEIATLVWERIRDSRLGETVPCMHWHHHPDNPEGEFIVIWPLAGSVGDIQTGYVNVNIYVPDKMPTVGGQKQRAPDIGRLKELSMLAHDALKSFPLNERWFFDVTEETLISEGELPYTFANYEVKLKKY